jgi:hypothetical protein
MKEEKKQNNESQNRVERVNKKKMKDKKMYCKIFGALRPQERQMTALGTASIGTGKTKQTRERAACNWNAHPCCVLCCVVLCCAVLCCAVGDGRRVLPTPTQQPQASRSVPHGRFTPSERQWHKYSHRLTAAPQSCLHSCGSPQSPSKATRTSRNQILTNFQQNRLQIYISHEIFFSFLAPSADFLGLHTLKMEAIRSPETSILPPSYTAIEPKKR